MSSKHGEWFDLNRHLNIHLKVIESFANWFVKSGDKQYKIETFADDGVNYISHQIKFKTVNGFLVEVKKKTKLSGERPPKYGLTDSFSYNCFDEKENPILQYHSAHGDVFNSMAPWHHKPHRHVYLGKVQKVDVYSFDDRPQDQRFAKYTWDGGNIELDYLDHYDWPNVKEFLDEVSSLKREG